MPWYCSLDWNAALYGNFPVELWTSVVSTYLYIRSVNSTSKGSKHHNKLFFLSIFKTDMGIFQVDFKQLKLINILLFVISLDISVPLHYFIVSHASIKKPFRHLLKWQNIHLWHFICCSIQYASAAVKSLPSVCD